MSKKTTQAIHFIDDEGTLHINGAAIRRHPEKPWLFSANDVRASIKDRILKIGAKRIQKADEREANNLPRGKAPKTPEAHFKEKAPSTYLRVAKLNHTLVSYYAKAIKKQAKDDIIGLCGSKRIRIHGFEKASEMRAFILGLDNSELCYYLQHGGSPETQGVWLCHQMLVDYSVWLGDSDVADFLISLHPDIHREVSIHKHKSKVSKVRLEHNFEFLLDVVADIENCWFHTQVSVLQYRIDFLLREKNGRLWIIEYDEHYHKLQLEEDEERMEEITTYLKANKKIPKKGLMVVRCSQGDEKSFLVELSKKLRGKSSSLVVQEFFPE